MSLGSGFNSIRNSGSNSLRPNSSKSPLKDDILISCISFSCYGFRFGLLAFDKSAISGPILDAVRGNY